MFDNIAVICTGNICRSPMGEALLRARLRPGVRVVSAGTSALVGSPADALAIEVAADHGLDIGAHRARQATLGLLSSMDLVLTMDRHHDAALLAQYPQLRGRVHRLLKWRDNDEVADPYRQPKAAFVFAFEAIERGVDDWLRRF